MLSDSQRPGARPRSPRYGAGNYDTPTSASNEGYPKVRNHGEGPYKCESGSSRFQPGDYEPSDGTF